jgi:hypothetical protein
VRLSLAFAATLVALGLAPTPLRADEISLAVSAAWSGRAPPNHVTEIVVGIESTKDADVVLELPDMRPPTAKTVRAVAGRRVVAAIPVRAGTGGAIRLITRRADGARIESSVRPFTNSAFEPAVALALGGLADVRSDLGFIVGPGALPRTPQAYDAVKALAIDGATLLRLDAAQRTALQRFVAGCGRLATIGLPGAAQQELRALAGCGGALLAHAEGPARLDDALSALVARSAPALRSPHPSWPEREIGIPLLALLLAYGATIVAIVAISRRGWPAITASLLTTALLLGLWGRAQPLTTTAVEEDNTAGSEGARARGRIAVLGVGRVEASVEIPTGAQITRLPANARLELQDAPPRLAVVFPIGLGMRHEIDWEGVP